MSHTYTHQGMNKNIPYAKVDNLVFKSLFDAESYCDLSGIDVENIEYMDDKDFQYTCQQIAKLQLSALKRVEAMILENIQKLNTEIKVLAEKRDNLPNGFDKEFASNRVCEMCNQSTGMYDAAHVISDYITYLYELCGWHDGNVYGLKRGESYL